MSELETPGHWSETGDMEDPRFFSSPHWSPHVLILCPLGPGNPLP